jgi:DNA-binding NarL/FixJ family response regulator
VQATCLYVSTVTRALVSALVFSPRSPQSDRGQTTTAAKEDSVKILVVDDHPLVLRGLAELLPHLGPEIDVRGATDPAEAVRVLDNEPDVALMLLDLALPGARGLDFLADLKLDYPGVPIVVLSATHDPATVMAALGAGAHGFIPKNADAAMLLDAVRRVLAGGVFLMPDTTPAPDGDGVHLERDALGLTARQTDVLKLLVQGKPNKLICRDLSLSEGTVKVHISAILKALHVHSRTEAVAALARRGISVETLAAPR